MLRVARALGVAVAEGDGTCVVVSDWLCVTVQLGDDVLEGLCVALRDASWLTLGETEAVPDAVALGDCVDEREREGVSDCVWDALPVAESDADGLGDKVADAEGA